MVNKLRLDRGAEVVADATVHDLKVAFAASSGGAALGGLDGPVVTAALGVGITAAGAALPLNVERGASAATAQNVGTSVARTLGCGTLRHLALQGIETSAKTCRPENDPQNCWCHGES